MPSPSLNGQKRGYVISIGGGENNQCIPCHDESLVLCTWNGSLDLTGLDSGSDGGPLSPAWSPFLAGESSKRLSASNGLGLRLLFGPIAGAADFCLFELFFVDNGW